GALRDNGAGSVAPGVSAGLGGALFSTEGSATRLDGVEIAENRAGDGGGIAARGSVEVQRGVFRRNRAERGGGAAVLGGPFSAARSTWHENEARVAGGGLYVAENAVAHLATSTIADNTSFGEGGGIAGDGEVGLVGCTVFENWARPGGDGGGLSIGETGAARARASVVAGSRSGGDCRVRGELRTSDRNLDSDGSCPQFVTARDPLGLFHDLKNYGGDTPTHLPREDSPVLDARIGACDGPDQRGLARGEDGDRDGAPGCDLGAVELRRADRP
ncbi:MAG: hypothetical protein HKP27_03060, partial [Myxococcales bacterium]|nr:hypothetical protein [Myxococcales bacterium]